MTRTSLIALGAVVWSILMPLAAADELSGTWTGPWYRGMTSGSMSLDIDASGKAAVQFTNLDNFGDEVVAASKVAIEHNALTFNASGAGAGVFVASLRLTSDGKALKGEGEYEGFPIKFKLKRH